MISIQAAYGVILLVALLLFIWWGNTGVDPWATLIGGAISTTILTFAHSLLNLTASEVFNVGIVLTMLALVSHLIGWFVFKLKIQDEIDQIVNATDT